MSKLLLAAAFLIGFWAATSHGTPPVAGCAFSRAPTSYEGPRNRQPYLIGEELAGYNQIAPTDTFFGTPRQETGGRDTRTLIDEPYVPPTLLKASGWIESALSQAASGVPWLAPGPALVSFDCGHGIMQITSGMTSPAEPGLPSKQQALVATHYLYNIGRGSAILVDKWNGAPEYRPVAGTDTESDPHIVENWYFAVWSYNGFTGPNANRSNHPADPDYEWPRTGFSCASANDGFGHSYGNYPYQELVFGCMARPPSVDSEQLWPPLEASLPDLDDPLWGDPLALEHFTTRDWYAQMDIPTILPSHTDPTLKPGSNIAGYLLGTPTLVADRASVVEQTNDVHIMNAGSGILAWRAKAGQSWVHVDKQGGVALGADVPCAPDVACERSPKITITIDGNNPTPGWVDIESLITGQTWRVAVALNFYDVNCDGASNSVDALILLQFSATLITELPCEQSGDINSDSVIDVLDALFILQFNAGML